MFSLSVFLENVFTNGFNRLLGGAHTHVYSQKSIDHFCKEYGFKILSEWWFGTDICDLKRLLDVQLHKNECSENFQKKLTEGLEDLVDDLQLVLDKKSFCSEVHMLLKVGK